MSIILDHYLMLEIGDRVLVEYKGRHRVAMVIGWVTHKGRNALEVRPHKTKGHGWCRDTIKVTRDDITAITRCHALKIEMRGVA